MSVPGVSVCRCRKGLGGLAWTVDTRGVDSRCSASAHTPPRPRRYEVKRLSDGEHYALKVTNIQELKPQVAHEVVQEIRWV